jgi:hypothetical protein
MSAAARWAARRLPMMANMIRPILRHEVEFDPVLAKEILHRFDEGNPLLAKIFDLPLGKYGYFTQ